MQPMLRIIPTESKIQISLKLILNMDDLGIFIDNVEELLLVQNQMAINLWF
jgi:DNA-directed RNA polymerase specialized sigma54-like protein